VTSVKTWDLQGIQESIEALLSWQALMYDEMKQSLNSLNEKFAWESNLEGNTPEQKKKELQEQLDSAIAELRFEDAAAIRDQIKELE
jgi:protein-arginine kinase activator protein McsA